jgi:hypothetical protein
MSSRKMAYGQGYQRGRGQTESRINTHRLKTLDEDREARVYPKRDYLTGIPRGLEQNLSFGGCGKEAAYFREVFGRALFATVA